MKKLGSIFVLSVVLGGTLLWAQMQKKSGPPLSPPAETSATIAGKAIGIKYSAPSVRERKMFGSGGVISKDRTYPVWRLGANAATTLHTEADLTINGLAVPKGDYTLYALVEQETWQLIISKQTGQWGMSYSQDQDLGRVPMEMSKPASPVETLKITISETGASTGILKVEFENVVATVSLSAK